MVLSMGTSRKPQQQPVECAFLRRPLPFRRPLLAFRVSWWPKQPLLQISTAVYFFSHTWQSLAWIANLTAFVLLTLAETCLLSFPSRPVRRLFFPDHDDDDRNLIFKSLSKRIVPLIWRSQTVDCDNFLFFFFFLSSLSSCQFATLHSTYCCMSHLWGRKKYMIFKPGALCLIVATGGQTVP